MLVITFSFVVVKMLVITQKFKIGLGRFHLVRIVPYLIWRSENLEKDAFYIATEWTNLKLGADCLFYLAI